MTVGLPSPSAALRTRGPLMPRTAPVPTLEGLTDLAELLRAAEGFEPLLDALCAGQSGTIDGAWGSSAALAAAALARGDERRTLLVVIAHPGALDAWVGDLTSLSGVRPQLFPALEGTPADRPRLDDLANRRLRLLGQLQAPQAPRLVLSTVAALMQPVPGRAALAGRSRPL